MRLSKPFLTGTDFIHVIIETPKGSRAKYAFNPKKSLFQLKKILPAGTAFPLNFGFNPVRRRMMVIRWIDVLILRVLSDQPLLMSCLVECRVIGVIQAQQQDQSKEPERNDRIMAIPLVSQEYERLQTIEDMGPDVLDDITHFFEYYRSMSRRRQSTGLDSNLVPKPERPCQRAEHFCYDRG